MDKNSVSFGVTVDWFGVNGSMGIGQGPVFNKAIQTPNVGAGIYGSWNPGGGKTLLTGGKYGPTGGVYLNNYGKPTGLYLGVGASLLPSSGYRSF